VGRAAWRSGAAAVTEAMALFGVLTAVSIVLFYTLTRHPFGPHYANAAWVGLLYLWALGWAGLRRWRWAAWAGGLAYGVPMVVLLVATVGFLHRQGGTRTLTYGATLRNQVEVAAALAAYRPAEPITSDVPQVVLFPQALQVLVRLADAPPMPQPVARVAIVYRDPAPRDTGTIILHVDRDGPAPPAAP
jgi:hypothetical protein